MQKFVPTRVNGASMSIDLHRPLRPKFEHREFVFALAFSFVSFSTKELIEVVQKRLALVEACRRP